MNWKKIGMYAGVGLIGIIGIILIVGFANSEFGPISIFVMLGIEFGLVGIMLLILLLTSNRSTNEKWAIAGIILLLWLLIALFYYRGQLFSTESEAGVASQPTNEYVSQLTSELENAKAEWANAVAQSDKTQNELAAANEKIEELQKALNKCKGVKEPLTPEEEIAKLKRELAALKKAPKAETAKKNISPATDVVETQFTSNQFGAAGKYEKTIDNASDSYGGAKVTYAGNIPADSKVGTTVTADRFRLYYVKNSYLKENGMSISAPRLNGVNGPEFIHDAATGYWYFLDTNTVLSPSMVNSWDYTVIWCIYIGRIGTWDGFLPHESMKAMMKKVRGREDGAVTMDELYKMYSINSDVWTDQNKNGLLMPKSFNPISGEREKGIKRGPEDGLEYQGWDFRTRTTGTITTEKVNGSSYNSSTK